MGTMQVKGLSVHFDDDDAELIGRYRWSKLIGLSTTYIIATDKNGKTIYLHRLILGLVDAPRSVFIDHIDGNGLNNSRTNLRKTDNRGNQRNSRKRLSAKSTSTYKGVSKILDNKHKPWRARIILPDHKYGGKAKYLGYYRTEIEAATAYNKAAIEVFGPMAHLNIISD